MRSPPGYNHLLVTPPWQGAQWISPLRSQSLDSSCVTGVASDPGVVLLGHCTVVPSSRSPHHRFRSLLISFLSASSSESDANGSDEDSRDDTCENEKNMAEKSGDLGDLPEELTPQEPISAKVQGLDNGYVGSEASMSASTRRDEGVPDAETLAEGGETDGIDWDAAWASTKRKMEKQKRNTSAFSGRKEIIASKNDDGSYDYIEISADGSRRRREAGGPPRSEGFGFVDTSQDNSMKNQVRDQEFDAVNMATTNKVCRY